MMNLDQRHKQINLLMKTLADACNIAREEFGVDILIPINDAARQVLKVHHKQFQEDMERLTIALFDPNQSERIQ